MRIAGVTMVAATTTVLAVRPWWLRCTASGRPRRRDPALEPYRAPRATDGHPDLNGIWQAFTTANWDIQDHEAQAGPHPELMGAYGAGPAGQERGGGQRDPVSAVGAREEEREPRKTDEGDVSSDETWHATGDPELKCYLPGVPRATYMPFPFQIVQGPGDYILMAYEYASATRTIRMNWKGEAPDRFVDGLVAGSLGGRDAGRRRDGVQARRRGSTGPGISTATPSMWSSAIRP